MWAESIEINTTTFTKPNSGSGYAAYDGTRTISSVDITSSNVMVQSSSLQFKKSAGCLYNSTAMPGNITKITLATTTNFTIYVGTTANSETQTVTSGSTISGNYTYFKVKCGSSTGTTATITVEYSTGYTVTYDANGATSGDVPTDNTKYKENDKVTVLGNTGSLAKTGYAFGGWNTQADGEGTNYTADNTFNITANTTLYAKWNEKTCTDLSYTGTPDKTVYSAGQSFDPTGLTVTATYNDASEETITASVVWTPSPLTVGTTSVIGTYMGQTVVVNGLTVTQATEFDINLNNTAFGCSTGNNATEQSFTSNGVSVVAGCTSSASNKTYYDAGHVRFYTDSYLKLTAPTGYDFTEIVFTADGTWNGSITVNEGSYVNNDKTWTGAANEVQFSFGAQNRASTISITLAVKKNDPSLSVTPTSLSLGYNETKSFTVSKTGDGTLTVVSNNTSVATVAADGENAGQYNVTYVGDGETTISVTSSETSTYVGDTKTVSITATDARAAAGISFASASQSAVIAAGTTHKQTLTNPNSLSVTYSSSNTDVATVASDGTVTLKTAGSTTIKATFDGNASYKPAEVSYTLTVTNKYVAELVFNDDEVEKNSTDAPFTNAITTDPDPIGVVYSSSNTDVATVNASTGEVTIVGGGTTTIKATIDDDAYEATEFTYTLTVNKVAAPISFSSASATTALDETESFVAPTLSNTQSLTIAYSSSNTSVATVDAGTGIITFKAVGNTTITATSTATAKYNSGEVSYTLTVTKAAETLPFTAALTSTLGDFTVTPDATLGNLWAINSSSAKASAYKSGNKDGESWLVSPSINISSAYATLSFQHAGNYFEADDKMETEATLWIREKGGDWEELTIATYPTGVNTSTKSSFVSTSNSLSSYSGKKVQIGFKYLGNTTSAGSWWVKNVRVADDREEAPISFASATVYELLKNKDTYEGQELTNTGSLTVSYTSSNTDVATVNASTGVVTIKAVGETDITATYAETASYKANTATYKLVVTSKTAPAIEYAESAVSEKITNDTYTQTLTNPNGLTVEYSSSDETVATINASTGEVTMLKVGETTITATFTEDEDYEGGTASYTLTVIKDNPTLSFAESSVNVGLAEGTYTQAVSTTPADLPVTYSSSDETVATVDPSTGEATLLKAGSTTITATFAGNDSYNSVNTTYTLNVVVDYATLPFSWAGGSSSDFNALTGVTTDGLGSDYAAGNAPHLIKLDTTDDYIQIKTDGQPGVVFVDVKMIGGGSTSSFTVKESADGTSFTDVETLSISGKQNAVLNLSTVNSFASTTRYVRLIFTKGSNVGVGAINVTKPVKFNSEGYTTFASTNGLDFSGAAYTAWIVKAISGDAITFSKVTEAPANTGLLLMGTAGNTATFTKKADAADLGETNLLEAITTATAVDNDEYYGLKGNTFVKVNAGTVPAGKALLPASEVSGVKTFTFIFETATGVRAVEKVSAAEAEAIFNLAGQRIQKPQRGINIVNGRKVVVK